LASRRQNGEKSDLDSSRLAFFIEIAEFRASANWDSEMKSLLATVYVATAVAAPTAIPPAAPPTPDNWCRVGHTVMVPDGREGPVTSLDGDICQVLVYGETFESQWVYYLIEPVYPQKSASRAFGH
jgi:hypothetical protein